jgi:hypothetical protein
MAAAFAIDGDDKTRWGGAFSAGHWLQLDLGRVATVTGALIPRHRLRRRVRIQGRRRTPRRRIADRLRRVVTARQQDATLHVTPEPGLHDRSPVQRWWPARQRPNQVAIDDKS